MVATKPGGRHLQPDVPVAPSARPAVPVPEGCCFLKGIGSLRSAWVGKSGVSLLIPATHRCKRWSLAHLPHSNEDSEAMMKSRISEELHTKALGGGSITRVCMREMTMPLTLLSASALCMTTSRQAAKAPAVWRCRRRPARLSEDDSLSLIIVSCKQVQKSISSPAKNQKKYCDGVKTYGGL